MVVSADVLWPALGETPGGRTRETARSIPPRSCQSSTRHFGEDRAQDWPRLARTPTRSAPFRRQATSISHAAKLQARARNAEGRRGRQRWAVLRHLTPCGLPVAAHRLPVPTSWCHAGLVLRGSGRIGNGPVADPAEPGAVGHKERGERALESAVGDVAHAEGIGRPVPEPYWPSGPEPWADGLAAAGGLAPCRALSPRR
jgi:hypothetical protein